MKFINFNRFNFRKNFFKLKFLSLLLYIRREFNSRANTCKL